MSVKDITPIWSGRKNFWCGLPTFTRYTFDKENLYIEKGFFNLKLDEVKLYRILDVSLSRNLIQRLFGLGTISIVSSDKTAGNFKLLNIRSSKKVRKQLSDCVECARASKRVSIREFAEEDDYEE